MIIAAAHRLVNFRKPYRKHSHRPSAEPWRRRQSRLSAIPRQRGRVVIAQEVLEERSGYHKTNFPNRRSLECVRTLGPPVRRFRVHQIQVNRIAQFPVQTARATSWCPFRSHRRHRRLSPRFRNWGLGPFAGFRCHRHRSCCLFTSSSARWCTQPRQRPRAARRARNRP